MVVTLLSLLGGSCWVFQDQSGDDELSANTSVTQIVEIPRPSAEARALETEEQWQNKGHQKAHMTYLLMFIYLCLFIYVYLFMFIYNLLIIYLLFIYYLFVIYYLFIYSALTHAFIYLLY